MDRIRTKKSKKCFVKNHNMVYLVYAEVINMSEQNSTKKNTKNLTIVLPSDLHKIVKITAIEDGVTMSTYVRNAIVNQLKQENRL